MEWHKPSAEVSAESQIPTLKECIGDVLLVEDEPSNRTVVALLLETMGMRVWVAEDGIDAVAKATKQEFDLILMDIRMPKMDGCEATRKLRKKGVFTPVIALTANSPDNSNKAIRDEFDCFLEKPVDSNKLYKAISKYLPVTDEAKSTDESDDSSNVVSGISDDANIVLELVEGDKPAHE